MFMVICKSLNLFINQHNQHNHVINHEKVNNIDYLHTIMTLILCKLFL